MDFYTAAIVQGLGYACMGLGIFISLKIFNIPDITTDGSYTLGGVVTAVGLVWGWNPAMVFIIACLSGAASGIATGIIHTRLKVNALLAGILVMTALYSINLSIMGRSNLPLMDTFLIHQLVTWIDEPVKQNFVVVMVFVAVLVLILTLLLQTDFGIAMRATGNNDRMVRAVGVNTTIMKITGLAMANALTAISGFLLVQYQGFADINMGIGIVISGLAAVMIGDTVSGLIPGNRIIIQVAAVVAGSVVFRLILAAALSFGLNPNYLKLVTAVIVLLIVAVTRSGMRKL